jgi:pyruvate dehydrogenase E2 component (dihydrolipoamide acetyltransferase)
MSRLQRTIAANMARSWAEIPHVTTFDHVEADRLLAVRTALADRHDVPIPLDALIVAAIVPALAAFPAFNATLDGDDLIVHGRHDIGVAVDTEHGLMVAVVSDAANATVLELSAEIARLSEGAKARTLGPSELSGQTFTVSNIGAVGGGLGTPIVPHGTTGILSVGRAVPTPVARGASVEVARVMPLSLSYDHRVIDGGEGRRFMAMVLENLAEPALFLASR